MSTKEYPTTAQIEDLVMTASMNLSTEVTAHLYGLLQGEPDERSSAMCVDELESIQNVVNDLLSLAKKVHEVQKERVKSIKNTNVMKSVIRKTCIQEMGWDEGTLMDVLGE